MLRLPVIIGVAALVVAMPATALAGDEDDEAIAEEALPTLDDLPDGWEESPEDDDAEESGLPECEDIDAATKSAEKQPNAESPNFVDPDDPSGVRQVEARIFVFPSAKGAKRYFKAWDADQAEDCLTELGLSAVETEAPNAEVAVEKLGVEGIGDDVVGRSLIFEIEAGAVYTDLFVARAGRVIVGLVTQDVNGSLPEGLDLLELTVDRVEEAL